MLSEQQQLNKFKEHKISVKSFGKYWVLQSQLLYWFESGYFEYAIKGVTHKGNGINSAIQIIRPHFTRK